MRGVMRGSFFGRANELTTERAPRVHDLVGWGWLYALHARSAIARGLRWQGEYMVSAIRDQAVALACIRHGLASAYGSGADALPREILAAFEGAIVRELTSKELVRAMAVAVDVLVNEIRPADPALAADLDGTLRELVTTASP